LHVKFALGGKFVQIFIQSIGYKNFSQKGIGYLKKSIGLYQGEFAAQV